MKFLSLYFSIILLISVTGCEKISQNLEEKVNKEVDRKIDETLNKADSVIRKKFLDSVKSKMDSSLEKTKKKFK